LAHRRGKEEDKFQLGEDEIADNMNYGGAARDEDKEREGGERGGAVGVLLWMEVVVSGRGLERQGEE